MNPGWLILSAIVGGLIAISGTWLIEYRKRKQFKEDFKEGILSELKEALPRLVTYYVNEVPNDKSLKWADSILSKLKEKSSEQEKDYLDGIREYLRKLVKDTRYQSGAPHMFTLSILKEPVASFSLLKPNLRINIIRIRANLNLINGFIEFSVSSYFRINRDEISKYIGQDIEQSFKRIAKLSYETAELIKEIFEIIFE